MPMLTKHYKHDSSTGTVVVAITVLHLNCKVTLILMGLLSVGTCIDMHTCLHNRLSTYYAAMRQQSDMPTSNILLTEHTH